MISTNRLLACLVVVVLIATVARVVSVVGYYRSLIPQSDTASDLGDLRQRLSLAAERRVVHLVAVPEPRPTGGEMVAPSWRVAWISVDRDAPLGTPQPVRGTVILATEPDGLVLIDVSSLVAQWPVAADAGMNEDWLARLEPADVIGLPQARLGFESLGIAIWDPNVAVYLTAGPDGAPGVAGHDDDGDGVIDNLGELGTTGSDDFAVVPGHAQYEAAATGMVVSRLISRGAIVQARQDQSIRASENDEVWFQFGQPGKSDFRQIMLRLR
jgi:hypothetical protein